MNNNPDNALVSVIIPVYQVQDYILETIKSVVSQAYKNIEIILINDGTKDKSIEIAEKYLKMTKSIYYIVNQRNSGLSAARNAGMRIAKGKYICFIDADDIISKDHIANLVDELNSNDVKFAFAEFENTTIENRYGNDKEDGHVCEIMDQNTIQEKFLNREVKIHACAILLDFKYLQDNNMYFNEKLKHGEDVEFIWRWLSVIDRCVHISSKTYKYLCRPNSLMTNQNVENITFFFQEFDQSIMNTGLSSQMKKKVISRVNFGIYHAFAKNSSYKLFKKLLSKTEYKSLTKNVMELNDDKIHLLVFFLWNIPKLFWGVSKVV